MADVNIQLAASDKAIPSEAELTHWCCSALEDKYTEHALAIRIVDEDEMQNLNGQYRSKDYPTNVLSFPSEIPEELGLNELGDIVICASVVEREANEQQKVIRDHWAHLVVHGTLHLQGYDHIEEDDAEHMEQKEIAILAALNINNPY